MNSRIEELYLEGENAIKNSNYIEAKNNYEAILLEDPQCCYAHNSLGWIYKTQFDDYEKAENHYKAAIKYGPHYPHSYWNLAYLYTDMERFEDLEILMKYCLKVSTIDKSFVHNRLGVIEEMKENFEKAIKNYKRAILLSLSDEKIEEYKKNIKRCEYKLELLGDQQSG